MSMTKIPSILIVDDEPRMCDSLEILLGTQDYHIQKALCGREALGLLAEMAFDVALLDVYLPDISGHELIDRINSYSPETSVIVMTGNASPDSAVTALKRGAYDFLRKPFECEEMLNAVKNALNEKRLKREKEGIHGKLSLSEERYRYLVQNSPDVIYTLDGNGRFTFVSRAVEHMLGFHCTQLLGQHYSAIVYGEELERAKWFFNERRTGSRASAGVELRLKTNPGGGEYSEAGLLIVELKSVGLYDRPVEERDKKYLGTHGLIRDISERKRLQMQLQHTERMETLGTLSGGIAHDFNNILMGIEGNASMILMDVDSEHPHHRRLQNIRQYVKSGALLTKQLLGFARGGKYQVKTADLNALIRKTSEMFGRTRKEISIRSKLQENLWAVEMDKGQIEQVLLNLYMNGAEAMPMGGNLFIESRNEKLQGKSVRNQSLNPGNYVRITVRDTGAGMDEETRRRMFEPFFTTKERGRGSGLGLASAYGIIRNHNGYIQIESKRGVGTECIIYLPASLKEIILEKEPSAGMPRKGTETVLLVDDEEMILDVGKTMLERLGYRVLTARSGPEAVSLLQEAKERGPGRKVPRIAYPDLVILDMIMPGMGGGETYDRLKAIDPDIKVLLSSGYSAEGSAKRILENGCTGFIQKPFGFAEFSEKVREMLDRPPDKLKEL